MAVARESEAPSLYTDDVSVPFELMRTMGKREHQLRFTLGATVHEGTLAQVHG